jgi:hypothetical protein
MLRYRSNRFPFFPSQPVRAFLFTIIFLFLFLPALVACEIIVAVDGKAKEKYKPGETVTLKITVILKHRNCDVSLDETDIRATGANITAGTKWVNTGTNTWERKIKITMAADKTPKAVIMAERTCEKDGGKGSLTLIKDTG